MTTLFILIDPVHWTKGAFRLLVWLGYASFLNRWKMPTTPQTVPKSDEMNNGLCASNGKILFSDWFGDPSNGYALCHSFTTSQLAVLTNEK